VKPIVVRRWVSIGRTNVMSDGASLHVTDCQRIEFEDEHMTRLAGATAPGDCSAPSDSAPFVVLVDDALYKRIRASKNGVRIFKRQYQELIKPLEQRFRIL
jgi:hypothetical protein